MGTMNLEMPFKEFGFEGTRENCSVLNGGTGDRFKCALMEQWGRGFQPRGVRI